MENPMMQAVVKLDRGVRLSVTWLYCGGPSTIAFNPMRIPVVTGQSPGTVAAAGPLNGKATTTATSSQPGACQLHAYADDGVLTTPVDMILTMQSNLKY